MRRRPRYVVPLCGFCQKEPDAVCSLKPESLRLAPVRRRRYVVPLVFYTMLRRWTTKRTEEKWPHRPLAGDEDTDEEQDDVVEDLQEIMVQAGSQGHQIEVRAHPRRPGGGAARGARGEGGYMIVYCAGWSLLYSS